MKTLTLYHTSPNTIEKIHNSDLFNSGLFFSADVYYMGNHNGPVYELALDEENIIEVSSFFYRNDVEKLNVIVQKIVDLVDIHLNKPITNEEAQELLDQSVLTHDLLNEQEVFNFGDNYDMAAAELSWKIQSLELDAAKVLGFTCAAMDDEQGTAYLVDMNKHFGQLHLTEIS